MAKFCQNCGKPLPQRAFFCPRCGIKIPAPVQDTKPRPDSKQGVQLPVSAAVPVNEKPAAKAPESAGRPAKPNEAAFKAEPIRTAQASQQPQVIVYPAAQQQAGANAGRQAGPIPMQPFSASPGGVPVQVASPFLKKWQTCFGASIGGCVVGILIFFFYFTTHLLPGSKLFIIPSILIWTCVSIWYACGYLPSLFRADCTRGASAATVSFANLLFGGVIFGCLWNSNLTSGHTGISNVVFAVCQVFCLLFWVIF